MSKSRACFRPVGLLLLLVVAGGGCEAGDSDAPRTVVITHELTSRWELLPHRVSLMELTLQTDAGGEGGTVVAENAGGSFGLLDTPEAVYGVSVWRSARLRAAAGTITIAIEPGSTVNGEPFSASDTATLPAGDLVDAGGLVAFVRGYRVSTDDYAAPPAFQTDPDLPYDPVDGYCTQGLGIGLGAPAMSGGEVTVEVTVRNSLGLSDRPDMNAAIPQATTWMRVDFVVVGVVGEGEAVRGEVSYNLSTAEYGQSTVHPHAAEGEQRVSLSGEPGPARALFGITAFDLWVNVAEHQDPSCVVVQDEINTWDEPVSGPGRYLTALGVRLWDTSYDAGSGAGEARLDLHFSNTSVSKEVGNLCVGARGEVAMLQLDDPDAEVSVSGPVVLTYESGQRASESVSW